MIYEDFKKLYERKKGELEHAKLYLKARLEGGLQKLAEYRAAEGLPEHLFRIRLQEVRVKECESLFRKINDDPALSFDRAFEPRHVHDLIGARLVCYNLIDLEELGKSFQRFPHMWEGLSHATPVGGEKRWVEKAKDGSGYRGWHVDVYWQTNSPHRLYYAELQIRTLLMDAFASLMHEDGYKDAAELPDDMVSQFIEMSDLLYPIDRIADRLRRTIQAARISPDSKIKILEAEAEAMFFMARFLSQPLEVPLYKRVERTDIFTIDPKKPKFEMHIDGLCEKRERFSFPVGGDSPARDNFRLISLKRADRSGSWVALTKDKYSVEYPTHNVVRIVSDRHYAATHRYKIVCLWKNIFDRRREYIWAPLNHLYPSGSLTYKLALRFVQKPKKAPRLFRLRDYQNLREVREAFHASKGEGIEAVEEKVNHFTFSEPLSSDNYLCFFEQG